MKTYLRTYLFRGKATNDDDINGYKKGEWIYGSLFTDINSDETYIFDCGTNDKVLVDADTICQYTGLFDGKGRRIFEGDIVEAIYENSTLRGVVLYCLDEGGYVIAYDTHAIDRISYIALSNKVIGNRFDNKELLNWDYIKNNGNTI